MLCALGVIGAPSCSGPPGPPCVQSVNIGFPQLAAEGKCCPGVTWPSPTACTLACIKDRADCNGDLNVKNVDGCEANLADPTTCGSCNQACGACEICRSPFCDPVQILQPLGARCPAQCGSCDVSKGLVCGTNAVCCVPDFTPTNFAGSCNNKDTECCDAPNSCCKQNAQCGPRLPFNSDCIGPGDACKGWDCVNKRLCAKDGTSCTDGECCSGTTGGECGPVFTCPDYKSTSRVCLSKVCLPYDNQSPCSPLHPCCPGLTCDAGKCVC